MKSALIKPKNRSNAQQTIAYGAAQANEIRDFLSWSEQQYFEHQFEQYEEFLKRALYSSPMEIFNKVRYSPLMRGLWNNEWIFRNERQFLPMARDFNFSGVVENEDGELVLYLPLEELDTQESLIDEYEFIHNAKILFSDHDFMVKFYHVLKLISKS
ncbi:hypothetical protein [Sphingobacterium hotanense]|uniref:Uncharacterized protein n=1 Tax=Sphingobacterium hotanense TaxID=649196 RepID=A0ABT7NLL1_9SPHI|nr:hypothetical protein [Sphingobacterium hotanense]MDM1048031.1 hypothetical protein [Sphingobacterium hotanense]